MIKSIKILENHDDAAYFNRAKRYFTSIDG